MEFDVKQLALAIKSIAEEKNLPEDAVKDIVEQSLAAAYRKDFGVREQEVAADINLSTGDLEITVFKEVVDKVTDKNLEISLSEAQTRKKNAKVGDQIEFKQHPKTFGRVAAQTAKQVILQRLREAEREIIMTEFQDKIGTVVNGIVSRVEGRLVRFDLGKAQAIMPGSEQIQGERYHPGQRLKVYLKDVEKSARGPQLIVSRGASEFIEWLFRAEVPEMENGAVAIKAIAREPGVRSKIAVTSSVPGVDPVGTFVGGHGTRVNAVMSEVGEQEKIDIVVWDEDPVTYIINALSPTKVDNVKIDKKENKAEVKVAEDQLSIAIGKSGQNVRLASKLTGYEIDMVTDKPREDSRERKPEGASPAQTRKPADSADKSTQARQPADSADKSTQTPEEVSADKEEKPAKTKERGKLKKKEQLESSLLEAIEEHGEDSEEPDKDKPEKKDSK